MHTLLNIHPLVTDSLYSKDITSCLLYVQIAKLPDWLYIYSRQSAIHHTLSAYTHTLYYTHIAIHHTLTRYTNDSCIELFLNECFVHDKYLYVPFSEKRVI